MLDRDTFYDGYEETPPMYTWVQLYKAFGEVGMAKVMVVPVELSKRLVVNDIPETGWHYE